MPLLKSLNRCRKTNIVDKGIILDCGDRSFSIQSCLTGMLRFQLLPAPDYSAIEDIIVPPIRWERMSSQWHPPANLHSQGLFTSGSLQVQINLKPFMLKILDSLNKPLISIPPRGIRWAAQSDAEGLQPERIRFTTQPQERFYGLGDGGETCIGENGFPGINRSGTRRKIWTENFRRVGSETSVPFLLSSSGYALFFHNPYEAWVDLTRPGELIFRAASGAIDFYFISAPTVEEILQQYYQLTGFPPIPPKWTFGYQQSSRHFMNEQEVRDLPRTLRARRIPCDHLTFLSTYSRIHGREQGWDIGRAHFSFNPFLWPQPAQMIKEMKSNNFHLMLHQYPQIGRDSPDYPEFEQKGLGIRQPDRSMMSYLGYEAGKDAWYSAFVDFTNPETQRWWWEKIRPFFAMGIDSWWHDGGEGPTSGILHEGSYRRCHNVHDLFRNRVLADNIRKEFPDRRVFLRCRSAYAGAQRYGVVLQPGDMDSSLDVLAAQIAKSLNSSLSGFPFRAPDVGGHFSSISVPDQIVTDTYTYTGGQTRSDEVYLRWVQCMAFNSMMWTHGHPWRSKLPWMRGPLVENILRLYIETRMRLIPYLYTLAWQSCTKGAPMLRPLAVEFPDDPHTWNLGTQFMLGPWLMVAPVLKPGVREWDVYLPQGTWYDFWSGKKISGGQVITCPVDLATLLRREKDWVMDKKTAQRAVETLPVFVRGGAILPLAPDMQYSTEKPLNPLTLQIYLDVPNTFILYEDDGETYQYDHGEFALTSITCTEKQEGEIQLIIAPTQGHFDGQVANRRICAAIRLDRAPKAAWLSGNHLNGKGTLPISFDGSFARFEFALEPAETELVVLIG